MGRAPPYHGLAPRASHPGPPRRGLGDDRRPSPGGRRPASAAPWPASKDHYGAGGLPGSPRLPRESRSHELDGSPAAFHTWMTKGENMSSPIDRRRLRDGTRATGLPEPRTKAEAKAIIEQLHDGDAALQSTDDLGSKELSHLDV